MSYRPVRKFHNIVTCDLCFFRDMCIIASSLMRQYFLVCLGMIGTGILWKEKFTKTTAQGGLNFPMVKIPKRVGEKKTQIGI